MCVYVFNCVFLETLNPSSEVGYGFKEILKNQSVSVNMPRKMDNSSKLRQLNKSLNNNNFGSWLICCMKLSYFSE